MKMNLVASSYYGLISVLTCAMISPAEDQLPQSSTQEVQITISDPAISESSGLAISRRSANRFWTHNDSGDTPRLFALDLSGNKTGECQLSISVAVDWEDMASYQIGETPRLVVADCGDNLAKRDSIDVYLFDEPDPDKVSLVPFYTKLCIRYPDGKHDCEAIAVDIASRQIVLLTKSVLPLAGVYTVDLPDQERANCVTRTTVLTRQSTVALPMVTAMDIDSSTGDIWVANYLTAFHYKRNASKQNVVELLRIVPNSQPMPAMKQIEAIAVDVNGRVWVTTEGMPGSMTRLSIQDNLRIQENSSP